MSAGPMSAPMQLDDRAFVEWCADVKPTTRAPDPSEWVPIALRLEALDVMTIPATTLVTEFPSLVVGPARRWLDEHPPIG